MLLKIKLENNKTYCEELTEYLLLIILNIYELIQSIN